MKIKISTIIWLVLLLSMPSFAQNSLKNITGNIVTAENEVVAGATVTLQNTAFTTKTDVDGNFTFSSIPAGT